MGDDWGQPSTVYQRTPVFASDQPSDTDRGYAAECQYCALGAVQLKTRQLGVPNVKTAGQCDDCAADKFECGADVGININWQHLSLARS